MAWKSDYGSWIRVNARDAHLDANTMNEVIRRVVGQRAESITQDPDFRARIGAYYLNEVTKYVPKKTGKLQRSGTATQDGRVWWSATSNKGYNYAHVQYTNPEFYHPSRYPGHEPTFRWTDKVVPGTPAWSNFTDRISIEIRKRYGNDR